jgi:hypothetical protein
MSRISGIGENKLRELMERGEWITYRTVIGVIADAAIWKWYEKAKVAASPSAESEG